MRKQCFFGIFLLTVVNAYTQSKPILTGRINGLAEGTKVWIVRTAVQKDSAIVRNGAFTFYYHDLEIGVFSLRLCREFSSVQWKDIYIDNSALSVSADDTLFSNFIIAGASWTKDFTDYERLLETNHIREKRQRVSAIIKDAEITRSESASANAHLEWSRLDSAIRQLQWNWVNAHPSSLVSSFLVYNGLRRSLKQIDQLDSVLATLSGKDNMFYQIMAEDVAAYKAVGMGREAPLFVQNDVNGKPFELASLRGSYVLVDFWASWCVPCRAENPNVLAAYEKFKQKGFKIVSVSIDEKKDNWLQAVKEDKLPWIQVSDLKGWNNKVSRQYYINAVPSNFLLSPEGKIIGKDLRGAQLNYALTKVFGE